MSLLEAVFLGVLQGVTEFLPVSSSGHLVLAEYFLGLKETSLAFDVTLHLGTLLAVLAFFFRDWMGMLVSLAPGSPAREERKMVIYLLAGTLPGAAAGFFLEHAVSTYLRSPWVVVSTLSGVAILLWLAERMATHKRPFESIRLPDALLIGISQALAVIPGTSRSGITMTCGLFLGLSREAAARFSFLLSAPIIAGAGLYEGLKLWNHGGPEVTLNFLWGFLASAVSGYLVIAFLMNYLRTHTFYPFVVYRLVIAAVVAAVLLLQ